MCTSNGFPNSLIPYGLKIQTPVAGLAAPYPVGLPPGAALELQRSQAAQLYDYGARIRLGIHYAAVAAAGHPGFNPYNPNPHDPFALMYAKHCDPRIRFLHEEPKPSHSYIGLIAMAILSAKENKMVLSDIYQWILDNYAYFRTRGPGWRNSIRHNLSLNDCFIKAGRSANGKGHYWAIHPANMDDFKKGDFRRRRAQRKVRKAMGLAVPDDEDSPSPPPPQSEQPAGQVHWASRVLGEEDGRDDRIQNELGRDESFEASNPERKSPSSTDDKRQREADNKDDVQNLAATYGGSLEQDSRKEAPPPPPKRRMFDVDSLLAPDPSSRVKDKPCPEIRTPVSMTYYGRPFPTSLPHPNLLPPPHLIQRDLIQNNIQIHNAIFNSAKRPYVVADVEDPDVSRPLEVDTSRDTDSENVDVASPSSPQNLSGQKEGRKDNPSGDNGKDNEITSASVGGDTRESPTRDGGRGEMAPLSAPTWLPVPMIPGSWKDHASAFRSTLPPGQRFLWGPFVSGSGQALAGTGLLRIPPTVPR
ncbi:hypothetical protein LSH36_148g07022 [Paralvinella palmiformis]|uniref:Fork-head domain-containing protein n=1 Tax=Paralvinella palmiformis TaxID=53620 RepID=A0AAD9JVY9_9ANNE|nr:hypothetical protein LSH36_148g07022 [Paralvinella palmiformis]